MTHESPLQGQVLRSSPLNGYDAEEQKVADLDSANIISSEVEGKPGRHKPVLDIDLGVKVIPSSTEGHFHLLIDKEMSWDDYQRLLWVLADVGIVEENYASASDERGYTAVRLPWINKADAALEEDDCNCPGCERQRRGTPAPEARVPDGCDCDDCHLEPDGRSRAETEQAREYRRTRMDSEICDCADCVPSPTHRIQVQQAPPPIRINWEGVGRGSQPIMDEVQAWQDDPERDRLLRQLTQDRNPYLRRESS